MDGTVAKVESAARVRDWKMGKQKSCRKEETDHMGRAPPFVALTLSVSLALWLSVSLSREYLRSTCLWPWAACMGHSASPGGGRGAVPETRDKVG